MIGNLYKTLLLGAISCAVSINSTAQTNTFPSSGNVGIGTGTTAPARSVTIQGQGGTTASLGFNNSANPVPYVGVAYDESNDGLALMINNSANDLNTSPFFLSRVSGAVGIGTTVPTASLTIRKDAGTGNPASTPAAMLDFKAYYTGYDTETVKASIRSGVDGTASWSTQSGFISFDTANQGTLNEAMRINALGHVGIGTTNPQYPLSVNGTIQATEVLVNTGWADYVFRPDYRVRPLTEVSAFIKANHHLPDIPSEAEVKDKGVSLGDMQTKLLAKIEELTLQMIKLDQKNKALAKRVAQLEGR